MHAEVLPLSICVPSLVSIAQAVFLLERGQSDTQNFDTPLIILPYTTGVGNKRSSAK